MWWNTAASTMDVYEVAALNALKALGYIKRDADEFDLVEKLEGTKSKCCSLLYQAALCAEYTMHAPDDEGRMMSIAKVNYA